MFQIQAGLHSYDLSGHGVQYEDVLPRNARKTQNKVNGGRKREKGERGTDEFQISYEKLGFY